MNRIYNLSHKLIACVLFISLFLQSCGGQNQFVPQEKVYPSKNLKLLNNPLIDLDKAIVISGGYLASFYEEDGELKADLRADEKQPQPNYKGISVLIEKSADLSNINKLDVTTQQSRIQFKAPKSGQLGYIKVFGNALRGGMLEGDAPKKLTDFTELRRYFYKGYLELTPGNYAKLVETSQRYESSFMSYEGGIFVKGWETSNDLSNLIDLLVLFNKIKKFKINCARGDEAELAEVIGRAIQFYEELIELDLSGCKLSDTMMQDIMESIISKKLKIINISDNNLSTEMVAILQLKFSNVQIIYSTLKLSQGLIQSMNQLNISASKGKLTKNQEKGEDGEKEKELPEKFGGQDRQKDAASSFNFNSLSKFESTELSVDKSKKAGILFQFGKENEQIFPTSPSSFKLPTLIPTVPSTESLQGEGFIFEFGKENKQIKIASPYNYNLFNTTEFGASKPSLSEVNEKKSAVNLKREDNPKDKTLPPLMINSGNIQKSIFSDLTRKAEQGDAEAQYMLGEMYNYGLRVPQDYQKAVEWYQKAAEQGYADAQYMLGFMYHHGQGVPQDYQKAVKWFKKVADQGVAAAQNNLGLMYKNGLGVEKDYQKAVKWFKKAADQNLALAQFNLGFMYRHEDILQDYQKAVKWYQKAADQGLAAAQYSLGFMYEKGQGVPQDYQKAVKWYQKAADQGHAYAQYMLGVMYHHGQGVPQDYHKAVEWYQKSADQNLAVAQYNLGFIYEKGQGVPQDYQKAVEWYQKSADQGDERSKDRLDKIRKILVKK